MQNFSACEILQEQQSVMIPVVGFRCFVSITGLIGNFLVILIYGFRLSRQQSRYFILGLAYIDFLTCLFHLPVDIVDTLFPNLIQSVIFCKLHKTVLYGTILCSLYAFVSIAFDRHRKICKPLSTQTLQQRVWPAVVVIVCLGCASTWPAIILYGESNIPAGVGNFTYGVCNIDSAYQKTIYLTLFYGFYYVVYGVSILNILVCYFRIWRKARLHSDFTDRHAKQSPQTGN